MILEKGRKKDKNAGCIHKPRYPIHEEKTNSFSFVLLSISLISFESHSWIWLY